MKVLPFCYLLMLGTGILSAQNNLFSISGVVPSNENIDYPAEYAPIVISNDAGDSWDFVADGLPRRARLSALAEGEDGTLWAATSQDGVFRLLPNTESWEKRSAALPANVDINSIAIHENRLVIGTYRKGIYYSTNSGKSWRQPIFNAPNISVRAVLFLNAEEVLAGTDDGLYYSADGGANWSLRTASAQINDLYLLDNTLYLARADGLYPSQDFGKTTGPAELRFAVGEIMANNQHLYALPLGGDIFRRSLRGKRWENPAPQSTFSLLDKDLPTALWQGLHKSHISCGQYRNVKGLHPGAIFRTLLETKRGWVGAVTLGGC